MFSAGKGGMSSAGASSDASVGRFQAGLLSLGSMHAHFGHVNQAMQALNEAVRIAQQVTIIFLSELQCTLFGCRKRALSLCVSHILLCYSIENLISIVNLAWS
jgi:hypothetical protein